MDGIDDALEVDGHDTIPPFRVRGLGSAADSRVGMKHRDGLVWVVSVVNRGSALKVREVLAVTSVSILCRQQRSDNSLLDAFPKGLEALVVRHIDFASINLVRD